jgi:hypothetical protein
MAFLSTSDLDGNPQLRNARKALCLISVSCFIEIALRNFSFGYASILSSQFSAVKFAKSILG